MKLLPKVLLSLLFVAVCLYMGAYLLPKQYEVTHAELMDDDPSQIYPLISNPTEWEKWSAWNKENDPSLIHMYGGPLAGAGARHRWSGDKVGSSEMIFTQSLEAEMLGYEQMQDDDTLKTKGKILLRKAAEGTEVVWTQVSPLNNHPIALVKGLWQKRKAQKDLQQSLAGLKTLVYNNSKKRAAK
ncbi:SRPBCC family protein [Pontibacter harenae]|uniref:SRPBCC family protein n=1 Tax=Pontibacter harenae TaxID=2894083 RepID=UPI001E40E8BE|nr:SRPBCC family protein [Pontibacter harenae]MCC9168835.1 SRPBCC family protein [Pontibacter harenae]